MSTVIYNVTIKVEWGIHDEWVKWMLQTHIREVVGTGCFTSGRLLRLLETEEEDGPTYAAQYTAMDLEQYHRYIKDFANGMRQRGFNAWGHHFVAFRSVMQVVN
jgi:hypothetical protein